MLQQKSLGQQLKKKPGFAPMTFKELNQRQLTQVKRPLDILQKHEFRNFIQDQTQKMMLFPGACPRSAFQEKNKERRRIIKDTNKELQKWILLLQKKIRTTILSTDPMTTQNLLKTYLQLAKECQTNRLMKDVLIEALDPSQHATRKFHLQHLLNLHHMNSHLFLAYLEEEMHKAAVRLWSEYILLKILVDKQTLMDAYKMRILLTKSPETILESIELIDMGWWSDMVSQYVDQHVVRLRVKEDMQLLRSEIKDMIMYTLLENYKNALMLIPSCIRRS